MIAIEVKSGGAFRNEAQVAFDTLMGSEGAYIATKRIATQGLPKGALIRVRTEVHQVE